ncbi:MAG: AAA family ATPase [Promethearchaeota archaeon]
MDKNSDIISLKEQIKKIQEQYGIIGREEELKKILLAFYSKRNVLIEGEVGTGKTTLAHAFAAFMDKSFFRVDGSEDVLSHVLVGYFDPPLVIAKGYIEEAFLYGPLAKAMMNGDVLFINELNRLPESTQNVLLSALDEGVLDVPKLRPIYAKDGFITIATMNPSEHVGVSNLGAALRDRFIWIYVDYQTEEEEIEIIKQKLHNISNIQNYKIDEEEIIGYISKICARMLKLSREHKDLRRGASIRAGIDLASIILAYSIYEEDIRKSQKFWYKAAIMALATKVELEDGANTNINAVIEELVDVTLKDFQ